MPAQPSEPSTCVIEGDGRSAGARRHISVASVLWIFVAAAWTVGILLYVSVVRDLTPVEAPFRLPWWALAAAFAATEIFVAHLKYRRDAQTYSLSEIPLLVGLSFATPSALLVGRLVGALFALTVIRRQSGLKLAFNLGLFLLLDGCLAPLIFLTLLGSRPPLNPLGWLAAYAAVVTIDVLSGLVIAFATLLHEGSLPASAVRRDLAFGLVVAIANTSFGLIAVTTLWYNPATFMLLIVVTATIYLAYRGYVSLSTMYDRLAKLFAFTSSSAGTISSSELAGPLLQEVCDAVRASYMELTLMDVPAENAVRWVHDDERPHGPEMPQKIALIDSERTLPQRGPRLLGDAAALALVRADLIATGLTEAMVAPLRDGDGVVGMLLAGSRSGVGAFDGEDLSTFQTLGNHLAVMLKNGKLVERLRAEAAEREHQATHDFLTDLPNRRALQVEMDRVLATAPCSERIAFLLLDLAGFRQVNDTLGHQAGDRALIELSHRFTDVAGIAFAAHLGGDEFAFLVPGPLEPDRALEVAAHLRDIVAEPVAVDSFAVQLRANVGVVLYPDHGEAGEVLLQHADMALRAAKETPQGLVLFGDQHDTSSPRRLAIASELKRAVQKDEISVTYQPQLDLALGRVVAIEALARWRHQRLGEVTPEEFIPVAEHVGVIWELTQLVLRQALKETRQWLCSDDELRLNLNLSVSCLHYPELRRALAEALREGGVEGRLVLELTESSLMADFGRFTGSVADLVQGGFEVSIDDFGIGYSSLSYVKSLHISEVKIDRSFIGELLQSPEAASVVKSIIDLAHAVGARAVAEGVEDRSTLQRLQGMGCDVAQGFFIARPMAAKTFSIWLPENRDFFRDHLSLPRAGDEGTAKRHGLLRLATTEG